MGPVLIFDKSTLQGLSPNEAVWLDNFYLANITPIFFVETLADLEKEVQKGRTAEEVVGSLAYKTPDYSSKPNAHHRYLLEGELFAGQEVDMVYGRPHITGGKQVELGNKKGVFFDPSPEEEALSRWQDGKFLEVERFNAKKWREELSGIDLEATYRAYQVLFPTGKPKDLEGIKKIVDQFIDAADQENVLKFGLMLIGVSPNSVEEILKKWRIQGRVSVRQFAPYFTFVFSVELFFNFGIATDLIGRGRPSHKIDLAYLYYLPFCNVFSSNDKLHLSIAPFFLREDQELITGTELKEDLVKLNSHYASLPPDIKARGIVSFAQYKRRLFSHVSSVG